MANATEAATVLGRGRSAAHKPHVRQGCRNQRRWVERELLRAGSDGIRLPGDRASWPGDEGGHPDKCTVDGLLW